MSKLYVEIRSGLGNQLFQFAFVYALSCEFNKEVVLCPAYFENFWKYFIKKSLGREVRMFRLPLIIKNKFAVATATHAKRILSSPDTIVINEREVDMLKIHVALNSDKNVYLKGYWQNPDMFNLYREQLTRLIQPAFSLSKICNQLLSSMDDSFVGVHVRRGDFLTNKSFGACQLDYYKQAIEKISSIIQNPTIIIFTNDKAWVNEHFPKHIRFKIYSNDVKTSDIEELYLMTRFKSLIISNSTFSWWGAYLNHNPLRVIICPAKWFLKSELQERARSFIFDGWIVLNNQLELKS